MASKTAGSFTLASDTAVEIYNQATDGKMHKAVRIVNDAASVGQIYVVYTVFRHGVPGIAVLKSGESIPLAPGEETPLMDHIGHIDTITVTREAGKAATLRFHPIVS